MAPEMSQELGPALFTLYRHQPLYSTSPVCTKNYTLTYSVYKEQMHTSLESMVALGSKKWVYKLESSGRESRWKWIFFSLW